MTHSKASPDCKLRQNKHGKYSLRSLSHRSAGGDLEVQGGVPGGARALTAVGENGAGRQLTCVAIWPRWAPEVAILGMLVGVLAGVAAYDAIEGGGMGVTFAAVALSILVLAHLGRLAFECGPSMAALTESVKWLAAAERATAEHELVSKPAQPRTAGRAKPTAVRHHKLAG